MSMAKSSGGTGAEQGSVLDCGISAHCHDVPCAFGVSASALPAILCSAGLALGPARITLRNLYHRPVVAALSIGEYYTVSESLHRVDPGRRRVMLVARSSAVYDRLMHPGVSGPCLSGGPGGGNVARRNGKARSNDWSGQETEMRTCMHASAVQAAQYRAWGVFYSRRSLFREMHECVSSCAARICGGAGKHERPPRRGSHCMCSWRMPQQSRSPPQFLNSHAKQPCEAAMAPDRVLELV